MKKLIICLFLFSSVLYAKEIQILSPKFVGVKDHTIALAEQRFFSVLDSLGYKEGTDSDFALRMIIIELGNSYLLNIELTKEGQLLESRREKFVSLNMMDKIILRMLKELLYSPTVEYEKEEYVAAARQSRHKSDRKDSVLKSIFEEDENKIYHDDDEEESFALILLEGVFKVTLYILISLSDYTGWDFSIGGIRAFSLSDEESNKFNDYNLGVQLRSSFIFGFCEGHSLSIGMNFAKNPSVKINQHLSYILTHRFFINKLFFFDFVWGHGGYWFEDPLQNGEVLEGGWSFGGDLGYNIINGKKHWLSLVLGYQHIKKDDIGKKNELSLNLVYTIRNYFED